MRKRTDFADGGEAVNNLTMSLFLAAPRIDTGIVYLRSEIRRSFDKCTFHHTMIRRLEISAMRGD